jgi:hypothetical protein
LDKTPPSGRAFQHFGSPQHSHTSDCECEDDDYDDVFMYSYSDYSDSEDDYFVPGEDDEMEFFR